MSAMLPRLVTSVVSNSLPPYVLQPARLLCPWDFLGKNTTVGCHALLQGNLPDPGIEPTAPPWLLNPSCTGGQVLPG